MAAKSCTCRSTRVAKNRPRAFAPPNRHASRVELEARYQALVENQSRLESNLSRYAELFDASPVGYLTLSRTGIIKEINLMGACLLGLDRAATVDRPLVSFVLEIDRQKFSRFLSHLRRLPGRCNIFLQFKIRAPEPLFVNLIAIAATPDYFQCALVDISVQQQAITDLQASEQRFRRLASHAPVGIFLCGRQGDIRYVNRMWCEITGLAVEQAHGRNWLMGVHPEDRTRFENWNEAAQQGEATGAEFRFMRPDGDMVWIQGNAVRLQLEDNSPGCIGTILDITERKFAQEAVQRLAAIVEFSHDAIIGKDINGIITSWNRGAEEVFGYTAKETIGKPVTLLIPPERWSEESSMLNRLRNGESIDHYETVRRHKSGRLLEISLTISPIKDAGGKIIGASKIARDITEEKRIHRELNRVHAEVLAASRAKDDFLATLSHELRTPLNPVLLLSSEAAANHELPPRIRTDFDIIRKNIELEARLIDDMLDVTRISSGKLELRLAPVKLHEILRHALATVQSEIRQKNITLTLKLKAKKQTITGDAVRLQQVFWNLLKNATKFTPGNGKIRVETKSVDSRIVVRIEDNGIGILPGEIERLFQAFSQGMHPGYGGLGLGLAICKKLVELHRGSIQATSPGRGGGATFTIDLPVLGNGKESSTQPGAAAPGQLNSPSRKAANAIRILLVEDHEPTRLALTQLLLRRGYQVEGAATLVDARAFASEHTFDLVISDIGLPDGSGYDLMREMRQSRAIPGIALTGYGMEDDVAKTRAAGFLAHLTKPVGIQALDQALGRALAAAGSSMASHAN